MKAASTAGYSGTPLPKKLGLPATGRAVFVDAPAHFPKLLGKLPEGLKVLTKPGADMNYAHVFAQQRSQLQKHLEQLAPKMAKAGMLWVSWPKKASKVPTDITEDVVREIALPMGLVDVKVCAVDEVWSGLKLVWRLKNR
ncbi:MAG TPA: hypothetical protein VIL32_17800 [Steroidobacteraceae bacterium]